MAVAILPLKALVDVSPGSQAIKKLSPDKVEWETELVAVAIQLALHK